MAVLTLEQKRQIRANIIDVAAPKLNARQIMSPLPVGEGVQEFGYDKSSDMSDAEIIDKFSPGSRDDARLTRTAKGIPILHKGFNISRIDMMSANALKSRFQTIAAKKVATLENSLIVNGDTTFSIAGVTDVYNNSVTAGLDWGTGTLTDLKNPYQDIVNAKAALSADGFEAKFAMMNPINAAEAKKKVANASGTWMEMIKEEIPNVIEETTLAEGTIIVGDIGNDIAELVMAEDLNLLDPNSPDQLVYGFDIISRVVPMFYEYGSSTGKTDAYCAITGA